VSKSILRGIPSYKPSLEDIELEAEIFTAAAARFESTNSSQHAALEERYRCLHARRTSAYVRWLELQKGLIT